MTDLTAQHFSPSEKKDLHRVVQLNDPQAIRDRVSILLSFYDSYCVLVALKDVLLTRPLARQWKVANLLWKVSESFAQLLCCEILTAYFDSERLTEEYDLGAVNCTENTTDECVDYALVLYSPAYPAFQNFCLAVSGDPYLDIEYVWHTTHD